MLLCCFIKTDSQLSLPPSSLLQLDVSASDSVVVLLSTTSQLFQYRDGLSVLQRIVIDYSILPLSLSAAAAAATDSVVTLGPSFSATAHSDAVRQRLVRVVACEHKALVLSASGQIYVWATDPSTPHSDPSLSAVGAGGSSAGAGSEWSVVQPQPFSAAAGGGGGAAASISTAKKPERELYARRVPGLSRETVIDVSVCNGYAACVVASGAVYVWGQHCFVGHKVPHPHTHSRAQLYTALCIRPTKIEALKQIVRVFATDSHLFVIQHLYHPTLPTASASVSASLCAVAEKLGPKVTTESVAAAAAAERERGRML